MHTAKAVPLAGKHFTQLNLYQWNGWMFSSLASIQSSQLELIDPNLSPSDIHTAFYFYSLASIWSEHYSQLLWKFALQIQHQLPYQPFTLNGNLNGNEEVHEGEKDEWAPSPCFVQRLATRLLPLFLANLSLTVRRNTTLQLVAGQCFDDVIRHLAENHLDLRQQK